MIDLFAKARQLAMAQAQRVQWKMMPELHVGAASLYEVPELLREREVRRAMVLTTPGFAERGTLASFLGDALITEGVETAVFSEVASEPDSACVERAARFYHDHDCDAMIAIGGGSVIDCAKAVGALVVHPGKDPLKLRGFMRVHATTPPLVAVPTTAGTGSEVTDMAVIIDPESKLKYSIVDPSIIPDIAVLDPALLVGLPRAITAYTGFDALTHAVEAYISKVGSVRARDYAKRAVEIVFDNLQESCDDPRDLMRREAMLVAAHYAGIAFTNRSAGYVHALANAVGGRYGVHHGLACGALLPVVLEAYGKAAARPLADLARAIGVDDADDEELARAFIARIRELAEGVGIPHAIPEIQESDLMKLACTAADEGNPAYPVPQTWRWSMFENVLRAVSGPGDDASDASGKESAAASADGPAGKAAVVAGVAGAVAPSTAIAALPQVRISRHGPLLDEKGRLAARGYATAPILDYNRSRVRTSRLRIKEWDYYLVNDAEYALALTISDLGYAALVSASLVDFARCDFTTCSTIGMLPLGRLSLPTSSDVGKTSFSDKRAQMRFEVAGGLRRLKVEFQEFRDGQTLVAEVVLDREPRDSMVIATPWADDGLAFYYNRKIVGMRAIGSFTLGEVSHVFDERDSFGLLDWGRGVWTRDNTWFWSAAQGRQDGVLVGFNLGYGFGDTTAATENMFFLDGIAHKLGQVDFGIPQANPKAGRIKQRYALMQPWHMTDDAGRLDLVFTPDVDRCDFMNLKLVVSDQHQVFGTFDGRVVLDDGSTFEIRGLRGFAEVVHNVY